MKTLSVSIVIVSLVSLPGLLSKELASLKQVESIPNDEVLRHVVFLDFNEQASDSLIMQLGRDLSALKYEINQVQDLEWGVNIREDADYSHCLLVTFKNPEDLQSYDEHPAHRSIAERYGQYIEKVAEIDYWH